MIRDIVEEIDMAGRVVVESVDETVHKLLGREYDPHSPLSGSVLADEFYQWLREKHGAETFAFQFTEGLWTAGVASPGDEEGIVFDSRERGEAMIQAGLAWLHVTGKLDQGKLDQSG